MVKIKTCKHFSFYRLFAISFLTSHAGALCDGGIENYWKTCFRTPKPEYQGGRTTWMVGINMARNSQLWPIKWEVGQKGTKNWTCQLIGRKARNIQEPAENEVGSHTNRDNIKAASQEHIKNVNLKLLQTWCASLRLLTLFVGILLRIGASKGSSSAEANQGRNSIHVFPNTFPKAKTFTSCWKLKLSFCDALLRKRIVWLQTLAHLGAVLRGGRRTRYSC